MFLIRLFCSAAVSIFIPSICFYYEILPRSLERKRVSLWPLTSDSLTDNDNIARPNQLRSNKINSAGLEDYYFIEWTFQAVQPLLLLLTVGKFMTGWFVQNQWRPQNMTGTIFQHWLPCQFLVKLQKSFGQKCVSNIINLDNGKTEPLWKKKVGNGIVG